MNEFRSGDGRQQVDAIAVCSGNAAFCAELPARVLVLQRTSGEVSGGNACFTAGLRINADAQVMSSDSDPIRGLYFAGERMGGIFWFNYP